MNIDKFYQVAGYTLKRLFNFISKPVKNFNIDNRAQKAIKKQKKAPWHETTNKLINEFKKGLFVNSKKKFSTNNWI